MSLDYNCIKSSKDQHKANDFHLDSSNDDIELEILKENSKNPLAYQNSARNKKDLSAFFSENRKIPSPFEDDGMRFKEINFLRELCHNGFCNSDKIWINEPTITDNGEYPHKYLKKINFQCELLSNFSEEKKSENIKTP